MQIVKTVKCVKSEEAEERWLYIYRLEPRDQRYISRSSRSQFQHCSIFPCATSTVTGEDSGENGNGEEAHVGHCTVDERVMSLDRWFGEKYALLTNISYPALRQMCQAT